MTAHAVIRQELAATVEQAFDLIHDYPRRLTWNTLLREAYVVGDRPPGKGVEAVCSAKWRLGGLSFCTRYVTFRRPELAAVTLVNSPRLFTSWAASIKHHPLEGGRSAVVYTLTFRCSRLIEPLALVIFRWETRRRLRALARHFAA